MGFPLAIAAVQDIDQIKLAVDSIVEHISYIEKDARGRRDSVHIGAAQAFLRMVFRQQFPVPNPLPECEPRPGSFLQDANQRLSQGEQGVIKMPSSRRAREDGDT